MLSRYIQRSLSGANKNLLGSCAIRYFNNEYSPFIPGGGLEKLQGGFKEESYFKLNDYKLMLKVREQAMRNEGYDTSELKDVISRVSHWQSHYEPHHQQGLMNKHKNSGEELFFLTEEAENLRRLENKMRSELHQKFLEGLKMRSAHMIEDEHADKMETFPKMRQIPDYK
ncbi:uncharacterized protein [Eurosta solidaginis]|uniref:uncharacterized protein n=1 Tax=Eurosta solidaginis TaxID=178769 RepID=UPI00353166AA